jgi:hypothetical protein
MHVAVFFLSAPSSKDQPRHASVEKNKTEKLLSP